MKFILCILLITLLACSSTGIPERLDGRLIAIDGKQYMIKHNFGDNIYLIEIKETPND